MTDPQPQNEAARLAALHRYRILDSLPEEEYDDLTAIAAHICGTPMSLISLIDQDRQWFKSSFGLNRQETPRDLAFCAYAIMEPRQPLVVPDARADPRFATNELVVEDPKLVFYAGVPLVTPEGYPLGTICVLDNQPRELGGEQLKALERLSRQVIQLLELRSALAEAETRSRERQEAYNTLRDFSHIIAHDLKAPIRNISQLSEMLREDYANLLPADGENLLQMIETRSGDATRMIDGVLRYSKVIRSLEDVRELVDVEELIGQVVRQLDVTARCGVTYCGQVKVLNTSRIALLQVFQNLIGNAIKFNDKDECRIRVSCSHETGACFTFTVEDNGPGIAAHYLTSVFALFNTGGAGRASGHGVGLAIVKRLIEALGGTLSLVSEVGIGTTFTFTLPDNL